MELKSKTLPNSLLILFRPDVATLFYTLPADGSKVMRLNSHSFKLVFTILLGLFGCFIRNSKDRRKGVAAAGAHPYPQSTCAPAHTRSRHVIHSCTRSYRRRFCSLWAARAAASRPRRRAQPETPPNWATCWISPPNSRSRNCSRIPSFSSNRRTTNHRQQEIQWRCYTKHDRQ